MAENSVLYTAVYSDVNVALADLEDLEDLHEDEVIGKYDAAVVDKENGEPHIVKRVDRPRIRVIPELLGSGTLPRRDLKDAAQELSSDQAALIVIGEPTLEKGFDKAVSKADKIVKRDVDIAADQLASEVNEASKGE
jgi:hypothetical protein